MSYFGSVMGSYYGDWYGTLTGVVLPAVRRIVKATVFMQSQISKPIVLSANHNPNV